MENPDLGRDRDGKLGFGEEERGVGNSPGCAQVGEWENWEWGRDGPGKVGLGEGEQGKVGLGEGEYGKPGLGEGFREKGNWGGNVPGSESKPRELKSQIFRDSHKTLPGSAPEYPKFPAERSGFPVQLSQGFG